MSTTPLIKPLADQSVLILGGTSGIGLECARQFKENGSRVMIVGRNQARGDAAADALGASFAATDCGDIEAIEALMTDVTERHGSIDTLVVSLGGNRLPELLFKQSMADVRDSLVQDQAPFIYAGRAVLPVMMAQNGGSIVNIASDAGKVATPGEAVIGANMAAIIQFTRGLAIEAKRNGIRANTITPSLVEGTPLTERLMEDGKFSAKLFAKARPLAHLGATYPQDLAALAVFLASPAAAKITGQAISVNGGISAA
ncbi:MAG: SDR family oxidoreductase [Pseudomonadota bacterium]